MDHQRPVFSRLTRLRDRVRSRLGAPTEDAVESTGDVNEEPPSNAETSNLFHCEQCGIVFIATEKETCANCKAEVEEVRSTLSCQ